jgi:sterol desaturase/sphingolipid hydroxylase (fatty acid hydroxylase superfamily)
MLEWLQDTAGALRDPQAWAAFQRVFTKFAVAEGWQYAAIVMVFWGTMHILLRKRLAHRLIAEWPRAGDVRREIVYSASSLLLYAAGAAAILGMLAAGRVEIYADPLKHGLPWLLLSLPAMVVWQDLCFYCTHRLMHTRWMFRHVHGVHHRSRQPSPWAAYAMHPVEAMVNGMLPLVALLVAPIQEDVLALFVLHQVVRNVHGHAAVESLPRGFARHWFWARFTTTTHHHLHHETAQGNYGLWFTWWDRLFGTERVEYLQRYDAATGPRPATPDNATEAVA